MSKIRATYPHPGSQSSSITMIRKRWQSLSITYHHVSGSENLEGNRTALTRNIVFFVDVEDVARLHPEVANEPLFAFSGPFNRNDLIRSLQHRFPDRHFPEEFPELTQNESKTGRRLAKADVGKGVHISGQQPESKSWGILLNMDGTGNLSTHIAYTSSHRIHPIVRLALPNCRYSALCR